ncbi:unnamed protein product [Peniophora sp. CBMAI 1063]|nr:unnamed protein product [Peniophora sp. CBMAI 1063]
MPTFRIDEAYLIGGWCASALWGIFGCFIVYALFQAYGLYKQGKATRTTKVTIVAALVLYALSTAHVAIALRRLVVGFVDIQGPGTIPYFADIGAPLNKAKDLIYTTSMIIADSVVVWRCWVVWNGNLYALALPILLVMGTAVSGYGAESQYFLTNPNPVTAVDFGNAMFAVSLTTNIYVTLLTMGRIWWASRQANEGLGTSPTHSTYKRIILLLFETGMIIALAKIFEFSLFQVAPDAGTFGFNALYVVFDMIPHINGIVPTAIIVIVHARRDSTSTYSSSKGSALYPQASIAFAAATRSQTSGTASYSDGNRTAGGYGGKSARFVYPEEGIAMHDKMDSSHTDPASENTFGADPTFTV